MNLSVSSDPVLRSSGLVEAPSLTCSHK